MISDKTARASIATVALLAVTALFNVTKELDGAVWTAITAVIAVIMIATLIATVIIVTAALMEEWKC